MGIESKKQKKDRYKIATEKMLSLEYRKTSMRLSLIGSDSVVSAYNELMQYVYNRSETSTSHPSDNWEMVSRLGDFLLEIRKSMGNESTNIDNWGMLEWFLNDARKLRDKRPVS